MMKVVRSIFPAVAAVIVAAFGSIHATGHQQGVKIHEAGVPQIMTLEGKFVRVAYNNEGYAILGYQIANRTVGEEWVMLDVGIALMEGVPSYTLKREAV